MGRARGGNKSGGKRRDRKSTVPGRKTRRIVKAGSTADAEWASRLVLSKTRLPELSAGTVVKLMTQDAVRGDVNALRLLLKVAGIDGERVAEQRPRRELRKVRRRIAFETAIEDLKRAVPNFAVNAEWERLESGAYPIFYQFALYICSEAEVLQYVRSKREGRALSDAPLSLRFLERALAEYDVALRYLVMDCVRGLAECEWSETIKEWAGPRARAAWPAVF